ncbi:30S ribosomal protein S6 [Patescibacteria group bacterium]|nr:30S ribosomal protein S6 [Patescibacteria group bacterium]
MNYELIYILTPKLSEADAAKKIAEISKSIEKEAGEIVMEDLWGKRELAYPIQKFTDGYYVVLQFIIEPEVISKIEKDLKLTEEVIRYLLVKKEKLAKSKDEIKAPTVPAEEKAAGEPAEASRKPLATKSSPTEEKNKDRKEKTKISDLDNKLDDILEKGLDD